MKILDDYLALQAQIYAYFGYVENWAAFPIDDRRKMHWRLIEYQPSGAGRVEFVAELPLSEDNEMLYSDDIYKQRHLSKWVYRGPEYTMIVVDTRTDGNKFLAIYSNDKEEK